MAKYLDDSGLSRFWNKIKSFLTGNYQSKLYLHTITLQTTDGNDWVEAKIKIINSSNSSINTWNTLTTSINTYIHSEYGEIYDVDTEFGCLITITDYDGEFLNVLTSKEWGLSYGQIESNNVSNMNDTITNL